MVDRPSPDALRQLLAWYVESGADEAIGDAPVNRLAAPPPAPPRAGRPSGQGGPAADVSVGMVSGLAREGPSPQGSVAPSPSPRPLQTLDAVAALARETAAACADLDALRAALDSFDGCVLRRTATQLVFGDGNPAADLMFVGEAPGAEEDRIGRPFVGAAGRLLDLMLAAIGLDRTTAYITNIVPWRPPGNRTPSTNEVAVCLPFIHRHIELVAPRVLVAVGGTAATALLGATAGITRVRGRWHVYRGGSQEVREIPAIPIFHTAYLLRTPAKKREAWRDLLEIRRRVRR